LPAPKVFEAISAPPLTSTWPLVSTMTVPARPVDAASAVLEISDTKPESEPLTVNDCALMLMLPASPGPEVLETIREPSLIVTGPDAFTRTAPALPVAPTSDELESWLSMGESVLSSVIEPAVICTVPALPAPSVSETMPPPPESVRPPDTAIDTCPASPEALLATELEIPVLFELPVPSILSDPAASDTPPAWPEV
jgi:hypothetical protein